MAKPLKHGDVDWEQISREQSYKLSQAEFKGMVIQALKDIREDIGENKRDIKKLQDSVSNIKIVSATISAVGGVITSFITGMGLRS